MSAYETKKRELVFEPSRSYSDHTFVSGAPAGSVVYPVSIVGRQTTMSRSNYGNLSVHRKLDRLAREGKLNEASMAGYRVARTQDVGGAFETTKHAYSDNHMMVALKHASGSFTYDYSGPIFAYKSVVKPTDTVWPAAPSDLTSQMFAKGATAIARTTPTNPVASTAQFLGELREGLPTIPGKHLSHKGPSGIADEFLNYEFGVKPFISDLRNIGQAVNTADKRISQLERDSGRLVRRRYLFPVERTTGPEELISSAYPGSPGLRTGGTGAYPSVTGKLYRVRTTEVHTWFSGAYTYLYPKGDNSLDKARRAASNLRATLGLDISPELLWELTPWSWAIDWVTNIGDVMSNLSRFSRDSLVLSWGYVMCTWTCTDTYTLVGQSFNGIGSPSLTQSFTTQVKKRVKATPYGFGLDPATFTGQQWAILSALGVSRAQGLL